MSERDTHFLGSAKIVWDKLEDLKSHDFFSDLSADDWAREEQKIIAHYAYDLVYHALYCNGVEAWYRPGKDYPNPSVKYERKVIEHANEIPDLTEWPTTKDNDHE